MMIISEIILLIYDHLHAIDSPKKIFSKAPIIPCINRICQYQWIWLHEFNTLCFCNSYSPSTILQTASIMAGVMFTFSNTVAKVYLHMLC